MVCLPSGFRMSHTLVVPSSEKVTKIVLSCITHILKEAVMRRVMVMRGVRVMRGVMVMRSDGDKSDGGVMVM